jgi:P-type Ca2+ transporter type 2C
MTDWYKQSIQDSLVELNSSEQQGLSAAEVQRRLEQYGPNELQERGKISPLRILWEQFTETMVVILIIAALISLWLGEYLDAGAILVIVVLNALLGFRQEYKAEQAMEALKKLAVPHVRARRDGHVVEIAASELVPGDIVLLEAGNLVPADGRLVESANLRIQEAALTGESEPVDKRANFQSERDLQLADRANMVYMGTVVSYGRGQMLVTDTGMSTELGSIAELMQSAGVVDTPLQRRLDQLGKGLALAALALVGVIVILGLLRGETPREMFFTGISMAVAAVPEGLPAVVTIALALGAQRMLRRRALIRKLPAVEALGSVTVICSDKTGTLTENRMTVTVLDVANRRIDLTEDMDRGALLDVSAPCPPTDPTSEQTESLKGAPALTLLLAGGALCNDALLECDEEKPERLQIIGDPTEGALVVAATRVGMSKENLEAVFPRVAEVPFDSDRKRMTTVHRMPPSMDEAPPEFESVCRWGGWDQDLNYIVFTKGAVDSLLEVCDRVWLDDQEQPLDDEWRSRIEQSNASLAEQGMRVLGMSCRSLEQPPEENGKEDPEQHLIFVGLVGMIDPARPEVKDAVETCKRAGIRPLMITGDHPLTARHIAEELGLHVGEGVVTGQSLEQMGDDELLQTVQRSSVYARVSPEHKLRIVQALQQHGEIAAMTGDGVNDAPALKKANIGVAMGITGTDVTKEAADMVLLDDNFATIVAAVEEGRTIYDNIRKFIKYTMTSNAGEIWVMLLAPFIGMPLPLLPLQILWVNLVTDGLPGLALGVEQSEPNVMRRPPYPPNENIFARGMARDILWVGLLMGLVSLAMGYILWSRGVAEWQTMVFTTLTLSQMGNALALRSNRESLFRIGLGSNRYMLGAVLLTLFLQLLVIYVPFLQNIFNTMPLSLEFLALSLVVSTIVFIAIEIQKWLIRRRDPAE